MSSALAMVLMAAMAVPGNGPEKVSVEIEQGLDLTGEWEGVWLDSKGGTKVRLQDGELFLRPMPCTILLIPFSVKSAGKRQLQLKINGSSHRARYRCEDDRVVICYSEVGEKCPDSMRLDKGREFLILHRVKPGK
jgi:hypothetical protein